MPWNTEFQNHVPEISKQNQENLTLVLLNPDLSFFENAVDPDQMASEEAI